MVIGAARRIESWSKKRLLFEKRVGAVTSKALASAKFHPGAGVLAARRRRHENVGSWLTEGFHCSQNEAIRLGRASWRRPARLVYLWMFVLKQFVSLHHRRTQS